MSMWSLPPLAIDLLAQLRLSIGVTTPASSAAARHCAA